ncbi:MAG: hypothetical protein WEC54_04910, partial [Gemmatimonadales bacterium]
RLRARDRERDPAELFSRPGVLMVVVLRRQRSGGEQDGKNEGEAHGLLGNGTVNTCRWASAVSSGEPATGSTQRLRREA